MASVAESESVVTPSADVLLASLGEGEEAIDRLLAAMVAIKRQQRSLDDQLGVLLDQLQQLHERGDVDASFHFNDTAFSWSPGRVQFTYPEAVLALEQQLKLARRTAEGNGSAVRRHGRPFWTIKLPGT
ncbi:MULTISPECIES: hypothetical protein [unclassified Cyanobium]|uniref:hypothetical protein n=1 Tax=unclassified Cyanobium TaxID=2627006 RepID=UPI0020CFD81C|nr:MULTISPECIES: hypothetical protein [unclassified Cyanobium]MCP9860955.1 hypothetical protein [Cyanobium sp. Cruz-8H5]MCP9868216.1 hypothetical protein [Cyanobium sp. Cruz-8D1]